MHRAELAGEAIRLTRLVHGLLPDDPEVDRAPRAHAAARRARPARADAAGDLVPLAEQDRSLWDRAHVAEGPALLERARRAGRRRRVPAAGRDRRRARPRADRRRDRLAADPRALRAARADHRQPGRHAQPRGRRGDGRGPGRRARGAGHARRTGSTATTGSTPSARTCSSWRATRTPPSTLYRAAARADDEPPRAALPRTPCRPARGGGGRPELLSGRSEGRRRTPAPPRRRTSFHGVATWRGVVRHGRALVPRAVGGTVRRSRAGRRGRPRAAGAPPFGPAQTGLDASRRRRLAAQAARRRRRATRTVPAVALVLGSATMLPIAALRGSGQSSGPLEEDPPSLTFRLDDFRFKLPEAPVARAKARPGPASGARARGAGRADRVASRDVRRPAVLRPPRGRHAAPRRGARLGHLEPREDSSPNLPAGSTATSARSARSSRSCAATAPPPGRAAGRDRRHRRRAAGRCDEHVSHQNGLDVDIYYPRLDRRLNAPIAPTRSTTVSPRRSSTASSPRERRWSSSATRPASAAPAASSSRTRPREPHARPLRRPGRLSDPDSPSPCWREYLARRPDDTRPQARR